MTTPIPHSDQKYIVGLFENNSTIIQAIYKNFVPKVVNYIKQNSGSESQAKDVVQEVLVLLYQQAVEKKIVLTCPFDAYFFLLCKRKWLNEIKMNARQRVTEDIENVSIVDEAHQLADQTERFENQRKLFSTMFTQLGKACQDLLTVCFTTKNMEEVAEKIKVSYAYARKKKSLCLGQLTQMIQKSDEYNDLKN
jgi:RNA polymerase sigma factor (sigma-70 family)